MNSFQAVRYKISCQFSTNRRHNARVVGANEITDKVPGSVALVIFSRALQTSLVGQLQSSISTVEEALHFSFGPNL